MICLKPEEELRQLATDVLAPYQKAMAFDSPRGEFVIKDVPRDHFAAVSRAASALGGDKQMSLNDGALRVLGDRESLGFAQELKSLGLNFKGAADVPSKTPGR